MPETPASENPPEIPAPAGPPEPVTPDGEPGPGEAVAPEAAVADPAAPDTLAVPDALDLPDAGGAGRAVLNGSHREAATPEADPDAEVPGMEVPGADVLDAEVLAASEADLPDPGLPDPDPIGTAILNAAGRATLPFQAARADRSYATAFWYNDLVESAADHEVIRQYLITAERRTRYEIGQFTLRDGLAEPELPADELVLPGFAKKWTRLGDLGVAAMPTTDLHIHAERKGWHWSTHEITSGLAARPEDIALLGPDPVPARLLGHDVVKIPDVRTQDRPQSVLQGVVTRATPDAPVRWSGPLPAGFSGAPVFAALPMPDDQVKLVCLGLVLPTADDPAAGDTAPEGAAAEADTDAATTQDESGTVVTFDLLRPAIHTLTPTRKRRWWQRG